MKSLPFILVGIWLASCSGYRPPQAPSLGGDEVGNGGGYRSVLFDQGRLQAAGMVERIARSLPEGESPWWAVNAKAIAKDLRHSEHRWVDSLPPHCPADRCACTRPFRGSPIWLSSGGLCDDVDSRQKAARTLLHEVFHQWRGTSEAGADRFAAELFERWRRMGHPDAPHWLRLTEPPVRAGDVSPAVWASDRMITWDSQGGVAFFDPATHGWSSQSLDEGYAPWYRDAASAAAPEAGVWLGDRIATFTPCHEKRRREGAGQHWRPGTPRWQLIPAEGAPSSRHGFSFAHEGALGVWGGSSCGQPSVPLTDGGLFVPGTPGRWEPIPSPPGMAPAHGRAVIKAGDTLWVWGGDRADARAARPDYDTDVWLYDLRRRTWERVRAPRAPRGRLHPRLVWTDKYVVVMGGYRRENSARTELFGGRFDLKHRRWLPMAEGPVEDQSLHGLWAEWTGTLVLVRGDRIAFYNPTEDLWTEPAHLINPRTDSLPVRLWTGMELILWGRSGNDAGYLFYPSEAF